MKMIRSIKAIRVITLKVLQSSHIFHSSHTRTRLSLRVIRVIRVTRKYITHYTSHVVIRDYQGLSGLWAIYMWYMSKMCVSRWLYTCICVCIPRSYSRTWHSCAITPVLNSSPPPFKGHLGLPGLFRSWGWYIDKLVVFTKVLELFGLFGLFRFIYIYLDRYQSWLPSQRSCSWKWSLKSSSLIGS